MAKLTTIFKYNGTFNGVTSVRSKTYGDHVRAARGTKKPAEVNKAFQESTGRLRQVNLFAKVVKDALDPYRKDFYDGTFWFRLLSLFRRQLKKTGKLSWSALEGFELIGKCHLSRHFASSVEVFLPAGENCVSVQVCTRSDGAPEKVPCDQYEETLVVFFLGEQECLESVYKTVRLPVGRSRTNESTQAWPIPPGATTAVVVLGCGFLQNGDRVMRRNMCAMSISKVVAL